MHNRLKALLCVFLWVTPMAVTAKTRFISIAPDLSVTLSDNSLVWPNGLVPISQNAPELKGWANQPVTIQTIGQDRYGAALTYMTRASDGAALNDALINAQLAMEYSANAPSKGMPCPKPLSSAPAAAKFSADTAYKAIGRWAEIRGVIQQVTVKKQHTYLNFSEDWRTDFTIYLPKSTRKRFDETALYDLEGQNVTVRGWVHSYYGPRITLFNPCMMERLDEPN